jgi:hypothetical protein
MSKKELILRIDDFLINIDWDGITVPDIRVPDEDFAFDVHALLLDVRDELRRGAWGWKRTS